MANAIPITAPAPDAAAAAPAAKAAPKVEAKATGLEALRIAALEAGAQRATLEADGKCLRVDN